MNLVQFSFGLTYLNESSLSDKDLVDVQQNIAAFHYHPLNSQVLTDVFSLGHLHGSSAVQSILVPAVGHLVMHLPREVLQLGRNIMPYSFS